MATAIQTCQWEKNPVEMANAPAHLRSAAMRHPPSVQAKNASGVISDDITNATCRLAAAVFRIAEP